MLLDDRLLAGIRAGEISVLFRRWRRPPVRTGTKQRTRIGLVEVVDLSEVDPEEISDADAVAAGFDDRRELRSQFDRWPGHLYRVEVRYAGPDPRVDLRNRADLDAGEVADLRDRLGRMDARAEASWTWETLRLIDAHPGRVSTELAEQLGLERQYFKRRVRRLKELGLTESLEVGYRISPRGKALLELQSKGSEA
ncbi:MAG: winged helix-turn-helix transcriptional regulator [bacterium]